MDKLRNNKEITDSSIKDLVMKIDEKNFSNAIEFLNLTKTVPDSNISEMPSNTKNDTYVSTVSFVYLKFMKSLNLFLFKYIMDSLFQPQSANKNRLAMHALELYSSANFLDIEFEVINEESKFSVKLHGVIVASRCMWFKRALSSGMKESINKY